MKQLIYTILFVLAIDVTFQNCANPGAPTGGPKDTIPPVLISSIPLNGTTNFTSNTIELEFSEYITAEKLKQQLIITPSTSINYKSITKRNKLIIKLDGSLQDSTTYNFNFADGVSDITEKNPAINLSIAFSTGSSIDSMSVKGNIEELLTHEPGKGYVVGLYPKTDSLNYFADKPMYFTTANDSGKFQMNYIKRGIYKILAFNDDNGNYLLDPAEESHGFLQEDIHLDSATEISTIRCLLQNVKPLALINARPVGRYAEIKFNKAVNNYSIDPFVHSNIVGENNDIIRLYKPENIQYGDTTISYIQAQDSLGNQISDTIKYVYVDSNRKPSTFSQNIKNQNLQTGNQQTLQLSFTKPIAYFDTTKISIQSDSSIYFVPEFNHSWNQTRTGIDIHLQLTDLIIDSLLSTLIIEDSTIIDSTAKPSNQPNVPSLAIFTEDGAFLSIENDTSSAKSIPIKKPGPKPTGVLKISLDTQETHFTFELLNKNDQVVYQKSNAKVFSFPNVKAGEYKIRVLIDSNQDGFWSHGNLLKNEEPEEVFIPDEKTSVRENWVVELNLSF
ncbi:MAG: Ig-like domain-containing protein [Ekhidna sp.]